MDSEVTTAPHVEQLKHALDTVRKQEVGRLRRFKLVWIVRHIALLVGATWVVTYFVFSMMNGDFGPNQAPRALIGAGLLGYLGGGLMVIGLGGISLLVIPFALVRLVAIARTDDLAGFERRRRRQS